MGLARSSFQALANAVWSLVAIGSRTVTVTTNNDKTGYTASTVSDKTGYALASTSAGTLHSIQRGTIAITLANGSNTATVTTGGNHQSLSNLGHDLDASGGTTETGLPRLAISGTTVTATRTVPANSRTTTVGYQVENWY